MDLLPQYDKFTSGLDLPKGLNFILNTRQRKYATSIVYHR